ncbi:MAG: ATP-binding protein, partial [Myxococcales bacterium]|nr:ATP-binding protein [Myxococcales bacterium]
MKLRKQLIVTNLFAVMTGGIATFWLVIYKVFWVSILEHLMFAIIATSVIVPWLNRRGYVVASRLLLLGVSTLAGAAYAVVMGPEAGIMIMFLPMVCAPLALFDLRDRTLISIALPFPILLAVAVQWYQVDHGALMEFPPWLLKNCHTVSLITATGMVAAMMFFLFSVHSSSEARLEQRYRELIRQGEDVVLSLNADGCILETNREAERALGYERGQLVGEHIETVDRALAGEDFLKLLADLRTDGPQTLRHRYTRKDGSSYPVELRIGLIPERTERILAAAHNVSERDELEARLRLADRLVSVGTLAAGVAHEVNNPLAYITLNLSRIRRRLLESDSQMPSAQRKEVLESLRMAIEGSQKVCTIVNDLKTFSRGSGVQLGPVDVERVLDATLQLAGHHLRQRAQIVREFASAPSVQGNEARLGQVFLNLVLNAAQAMTRGNPLDELRLKTVKTEDGRVCVEIHDTGHGILPEDLPRIFDPFFTTKKDNTGTGLGLYVCRSIIAECDGDLTVTSEPGTGTVVRVLLHASHAQERQERVFAEPRAKPAGIDPPDHVV